MQNTNLETYKNQQMIFFFVTFFLNILHFNSFSNQLNNRVGLQNILNLIYLRSL